MTKIQRFTRKNGSTIHSLTIPKNIIEQSGLKKNDEVEFMIAENGNIIIIRQ